MYPGDYTRVRSLNSKNSQDKSDEKLSLHNAAETVLYAIRRNLALQAPLSSFCTNIAPSGIFRDFNFHS